MPDLVSPSRPATRSTVSVELIEDVAAQLEHQCRGGEVIVSEAMLGDTETAAALGAGHGSKKKANYGRRQQVSRFVRVVVREKPYGRGEDMEKTRGS